MFLKGSTFLCLHSIGKFTMEKLNCTTQCCILVWFGAEVGITCLVSAAASQKGRSEGQVGSHTVPPQTTVPASGVLFKPNQALWQLVQSCAVVLELGAGNNSSRGFLERISVTSWQSIYPPLLGLYSAVLSEAQRTHNSETRNNLADL